MGAQGPAEGEDCWVAGGLGEDACPGGEVVVLVGGVEEGERAAADVEDDGERAAAVANDGRGLAVAAGQGGIGNVEDVYVA
ncbi:hypothetical protein I6A84_22565 [Frankia sp. CNm7]|uniref:Uncharacterized protein n=1 Tax=Frankia nepalensis TaxID=1836974 RepID=A0A937UQE9_9ACTN|nr:hypothetical protein [Frankia nepalensis]MBL7498301.1 hypothetical protein [Frankia nepalensis]MBL7509107.1 hypothetical protein [Frankia nepalensis]MBL7520794.1 hypothetical protein [Frankia nepalensis]MBL7630152.1 hypothetical protein [Frankia nepalensis]